MAKDDLKFEQDLGFEPEILEKQKEEDSNIGETISDLVRGAAQGATFGFADELEAALKAGTETALGPAKLENLPELYRKYRDISRKEYQQATERSPIASTIGNVGGAIVPAIATGGATGVGSIGKLLSTMRTSGATGAALTGAAGGAVSGLGAGEADITKGELGEVAKEIAGGAALGGLVGGGASLGAKAAKGAIGAGKAAAKEVSELPIVQTTKDVVETEFKGTPLTGVSAQRTIIRETEDLADTIANELKIQKLAAQELSEETGEKIAMKTPDSNKIFRLIEKAGKGEEEVSSRIAQRQLDEMLEPLSNVKQNQIKSLIDKTSKKLDLTKQVQAKGAIQQSPILGTAKAATLRGAALGGRAIGKIASSITEATPEQLQTVARDLVSKGDYKVARELIDIIKKDSTGRNAALFALQQNPEYRKKLNSYFGDNKENE